VFAEKNHVPAASGKLWMRGIEGEELFRVSRLWSIASAGKLREGVQLLGGDREQYDERVERQYVVGQREQQQ